MRPAFHSILVHITTGPLILAFLMATFRLWLRPRSGKSSGYELISQALGYRTRHALYFPTLLNVALVIIGIAVLAGAVIISMRRRSAEHREIS